MDQPPDSSQTVRSIETPTSRAFGASIQVQMGGAASFLVVGRQSSPESLVQAVGGQVIARLGERRVLAVMPVAAGFGLGAHPQIQLCGPVSIDFKRLAAVLGGQQSTGETPEGGKDGR
ncbi:MAG: hypothetical protein ACK2UW_17450 [Anaerolineales bacterium]